MEKISVIIPVYNVEKYLKNCLDSIVNQDYQNLEIILVNDGSTDNSSEICANYADHDSRIKYIVQENQGTSAAKNAGLGAASGDLITFVDADDWYANSQSLTVLHKMLKTDDTDIAVGNFNEFDDSKAAYFIHVFTDKPSHLVFNPMQWFKNEYNDEESISQCFSTPWGKLFKRQFFKDIRFPEGKIDEDDLTMWKTFLLANKISYTNQPIYVYRNNRTNSITNVANNAQLFSIPAIDQRITMENKIHFDHLLSQEINAYIWRLQMHRNNALKVAELPNFKQAQQSIDIINKYSDSQY